MVSNVQNQWFLLGAAVVGLVSAAAVYVVEHIRKNRKELARLDQQMNCLRADLSQLLASQKSAKGKKKSSSVHARRNHAPSSVSDDYTSATDFESSDLEFYDLSDDEDTLRIDAIDGQLGELDEQLEDESEASLLKSIETLKILIKEYPNQSELYWRLGKAYYKLVRNETDPKLKEENINLGIEECSKALELNSTSADAHKWYAILIGLRGEFQPIKSKIQDSYIFKEHVDMALKLKPNDPTLHHLMGRFAYEVASLKWYERKAASALFTEPPKATYEDALSHLLESEKLSTEEWKENKLFLAKCYIDKGEYKEGVSWLEKADSLSTNEGENIDAEIKQLLEKYGSYR